MFGALLGTQRNRASHTSLPFIYPPPPPGSKPPTLDLQPPLEKYKPKREEIYSQNVPKITQSAKN